MSFAPLGLRAELLNAALDLGLHDATPIQSQSIPAALAGRDLWACAPTGSGKTMAYLMPLLQQWMAQKRSHTGFVRPLSTLILVPTRELAQQVHESLSDLTRKLHDQPRSRVVYGGVSINPQMMQLRGSADFLVATPGRLLDLVDSNAVRLNTVQKLVLDEADRLLDMGFGEQVGQLLSLLPRSRQSLLFSATFPDQAGALAAASLRNPQRFEVGSAATPAVISERVIAVDDNRRNALLQHLAEAEGWGQVLVFVASQRSSENLAEKLAKVGLSAEALHGDLGQGRRQRVLRAFAEGQLQWLVATDVAARGIDIAGLPRVVNFDLPRSTDDYVHRIGRVGRAGVAGEAVSLVSAASEAHMRLIEKRQGRRLGRQVIAGFEPVQAAVPVAGASADNGGIKGKRPSKKDKLRAAAAAAAGKPEAG